KSNVESITDDKASEGVRNYLTALKRDGGDQWLLIFNEYLNKDNGKTPRKNYSVDDLTTLDKPKTDILEEILKPNNHIQQDVSSPIEKDKFSTPRNEIKKLENDPKQKEEEEKKNSLLLDQLDMLRRKTLQKKSIKIPEMKRKETIDDLIVKA